MSVTKASSSVFNLASGSFAYFLFIALMMAYGLYAVFVTGPNMRSAAQQQLARITAEENATFCGKFGMRVQSSEFVACGQELAIVRQKQADRDSEAAQGLR
jgi:hypothetical protein